LIYSRKPGIFSGDSDIVINSHVTDDNSLLMVFLSVALSAKANRLTNSIVGILYFVVVIGNTIGEKTKLKI